MGDGTGMNMAIESSNWADYTEPSLSLIKAVVFGREAPHWW